MRRLLSSCLLLATGLILALSVPQTAAADTSDFTFDSFDATYTLSRMDDGTANLDVVETIVARFPETDQNRGIVRAIPDSYDGVDLSTVVTSVVDESGRAVPFETDRSDEFVTLALGTDEFVHGAVTYVITYSQRNVVRSFADTDSDEFYWDVNGTGWEQPFGRVSAEVTIDDSASGALSGNVACYLGSQGDDRTCPIDGPTTPSTTGSTFSASADNLAPRENLTVSIGFAPGTFLTPEPTVNVPRPVPAGFDFAAGGIGLLSLGGVIAAIVARVRSGRGAKGSGIIIAQYSEPDSITIMQSAHLMARPQTAVPAALVRLAVRKNLRILAYSVTEGGEPYTLQFLGTSGTNPEDLELIELVFGSNPEPGALREFGQGQLDLMASLVELSTRAGLSLQSTGYLEKPPGRGVAIAIVAGQLVLGIVAIALLVASNELFLNVSAITLPIMGFGVIALALCLALAIRGLRPTAKGVEAKQYLEGMRTYLTLAEKDRLRALQ
ncbi:MAG: DUF2207 domain-containing protein, partial [Salinibacterium sp.]|nr:DUF2207 domain-containing protein [Salinibacterium sp.]